MARRSDGRPYSHIGDLQQAYDGLGNVRAILEREMHRPAATLTERGLEVLLKRYSEVQALQSRLMMTSQNIDSSIERLYQAFKRYARPMQPSVSPYAGIRDEDIQRLRSRPLRQLQPDDVRAYARHALSTWGDDLEFRHYLPRLFELLVVAPHWTDAALLIGKLHPDWQGWPDDERSAVVQFLSALWDWAIESSPDAIAARDVLRGAGLAGLDLAPFLGRWQRADSHSSAVQLASFVLIEEPQLLRGLVGTSWHPKDRDQVARFLLAPEARAKLEAAYLGEPDHLSARDLSDAVAVLEAAPAGQHSG